MFAALRTVRFALLARRGAARLVQLHASSPTTRPTPSRPGWPTTISISTRSRSRISEALRALLRLAPLRAASRIRAVHAAPRATACRTACSREDVLWFVDGLRSALPHRRAPGAPRRRRAARDAHPGADREPPAQVGQGQPEVREGAQGQRHAGRAAGGRSEAHHQAARRNGSRRSTASRKQRVHRADARAAPARAAALRRAPAAPEGIPRSARAPQRRPRSASPRGSPTGWSNWERGRSAEYQKQLDASWQKRAELFVARRQDVHARSSAPRRSQRMQDYAEDFTQLARRRRRRALRRELASRRVRF